MRKKGLGTIKKAKLKGEDVLVRIIKFDRLRNYVFEEICKEVNNYILQGRDELLEIMGYYISPSNELHLFMPKLVSLYQLLHSGVKLLPHEKIKIASKVAEGMSFLHRMGKAHTHLSSHNILINVDMEVKIADYDLFMVKKFASVFLRLNLKNAWSSPEILGGTYRYDSGTSASILQHQDSDPMTLNASDVFSYGIVLWEMETEKVPFEQANQQALRKYIFEEDLRP